MALAASLVLEVRATGSDSNGGGFDPASGTPGTDYSRQDLPQVTYTDLVIDGTTNTKVTSAATPFTSAHVGNLINVTSGTGFTVQRVQVMSVTAAVATCDKSLGTLGSTGGNGKLGGALATPGQATAVATVSGHIIHVKSGTYSLGSTSNVAGGRLALTGGVSLYGYEATRYDIAARPVFNAGAASMTCITGATSAVLSGFEITNTSANASVIGFSTSSNNLVDRCKVTGCATGYTVAADTRFFDCEASGCTVGYAASNSCTFRGCIAIGCTSQGFQEGGFGNATFVDCIAIGTTAGRGFSTSSTGTTTFINCTSRGHQGATGRGFELGARSELINCLAVGNADYGFFSGSAANKQIRIRSCAGYSNTAGNSNSGFLATTIVNLIACSADPNVDAAGGDYRLNSTAGGGALLRGAGWPQSYPGYAAANAPDIGAYQHADPSATATSPYRRRIRPLGT